MSNQNDDPGISGSRMEMIVPPTITPPREGQNEEIYRPSYEKPVTNPRRPIFRIVFVAWIVLVIAAAGYLVFSKLALSPEKLLAEAWLNLSKIESAHTEIDLTYTDQNPEDSSQKITVSLGMVVDQTSKSEDGDFALKMNAKFEGEGINDTIGGEADQNFEFSFEIRKIGEDYYFNFDIFQILFSFFASGPHALEQDEGEATWIKTTESEFLEKQGEDPQEFQELQSQYQEAFETFQKEHPLEIAKILENIQSIGTEEVDNQKVVRISADVNEAELIDFVVAWFREVLEVASQEEPALAIEEEEFEEAVAEFKKVFDQWEVKRLEFVIGKKDRMFREILIETNAPSVLSTFDTARSLSRDARRLADIRQIMTALELYYNDCLRYPQTLDGAADQGCPSGIDLSSIIPTIPAAPMPADGSCSETDNTYTYNAAPDGQSYGLTACLGETTGGIGPGLIEASQSGLRSLNEAASQTPPTADELSNEDDLQFNASFTLIIKASNINQPIQIPIPPNALDFKAYEQNINEYSTATSIREALNIYHSQHGRYPRYLVDLTAEDSNSSWYFPEVKQAQNTAGECEGINPYYNYGPTDNDQNYHLEFCLIAPVGSLNQGKHAADKNGIDGKADDDSFFPLTLGKFLENLDFKTP